MKGREKFPPPHPQEIMLWEYSSRNQWIHGEKKCNLPWLNIQGKEVQYMNLKWQHSKIDSKTFPCHSLEQKCQLWTAQKWQKTHQHQKLQPQQKHKSSDNQQEPKRNKWWHHMGLKEYPTTGPDLDDLKIHWSVTFCMGWMISIWNLVGQRSTLCQVNIHVMFWAEWPGGTLLTLLEAHSLIEAHPHFSGEDHLIPAVIIFAAIVASCSCRWILMSFRGKVPCGWPEEQWCTHSPYGLDTLSRVVISFLQTKALWLPCWNALCF